MNKLTSLLITSLAGALTLGGAACSSSSGTPATTGNGGTSGGSNTVPLPSTSTGFVDDITSGVIGAWFAYGDGVGSNAGVGDAGTDQANSDCIKKGGFTADQC